MIPYGSKVQSLVSLKTGIVIGQTSWMRNRGVDGYHVLLDDSDETNNIEFVKKGECKVLEEPKKIIPQYQGIGMPPARPLTIHDTGE